MNKLITVLDTHNRQISELADVNSVSAQTVITALFEIALGDPDLRTKVCQAVKQTEQARAQARQLQGMETRAKATARHIRNMGRNLADGDGLVRQLEICSKNPAFKKIWESVRQSYPDYSPDRPFVEVV